VRVLTACVLMLLFLAALAYDSRSGPPAPGSLLICGGGDLPSEIRREFIRLAGGPAARIVVIPTATSNADRPEYLASLQDEWPGATILHTRCRDIANDPEFAAPLRDATGVWITGGDQVFLTDAYAYTLIHEELLSVLARRGVIGGTSAGAAVMSGVMIRGGDKVADVGYGFGFIKDVVIDQHFIRRNRIDRLCGVVEQRPWLLGLGIDEQTALLIQGDELKVLGRSTVTAYSKGWFETLRDGDSASLTYLRGN